MLLLIAVCLMFLTNNVLKKVLMSKGSYILAIIIALLSCYELVKQQYLLHMSLQYGVTLCVRMNDTTVSMTFSEWEKKLQDSHSCLKMIPVRQHLTLPPKYLGKVADGIREQLDSKLKLYSEEYVILFAGIDL